MIIGVIIAIAVVAGGISYKAARDAQKAAKKAADAMAGVLLNKESNIEPIPVIYGERRVGGVRVFVKAAGGQKNEYLYIALALCEGEVESISDIYIDDTPITDPKYDGLHSVQTFTGTDNQAVSTILQEAGAEWTADHRLRGVAYIAIRLKWDTDAFSGMPDITAVVKGRKVYDPRTATTAWSDNPALCIRDYLTNNRFGKGLPSNSINDTAFSQAATDLESFTATPYSGAPSTIQLFRTNIVLDTGDEIFRNVEKMLLGCRGFLPYTQGQYALKIDQATTSLMTLDTTTIIGGIKIAGAKKEDKFNRVVVKFPNPQTDWQPDQAVWPEAGSAEETAYLAEDGGTLLVDEVDLDGVTNYYSARDIARILVLRSRNALRVGLQATSEALDLTIGDVVSITHPTPGWVAKPFQVEEMSLNYDATVNLSLIEYDSAVYAYDPANEEVTYPDSNLPNPFEVEPPTNLTVTETTAIGSDGTVLPALLVEWTAADDAFVSQYEVQWQIDGESEYSSAFTGTNQYIIQNVSIDDLYNIRVRSYNALGARSIFVTTTTTPGGDTTAPAVPSSVTAVGGLREISISWAEPTDADYSHVEIYESDADVFSGATKIAIASGDHYVRTGLSYGVTKYYWLKSVDFTGNVSSESLSANATTLFVDSDAFSSGVNDLFTEAGLYGVQPVDTLPASGEFEGQVVYLTTDNKLYRWDGSAWTAAVPAGDILGQITETQISDDSISTPKLKAGSITTAKLSVGDLSVLNQNPGFEEGDVAWSGDPEFTIENSNARTGSYSMKFTSTTGSARVYSETQIVATEGETFYIEGYIKHGGGTVYGARVSITAYNSSGSSIGGASSILVTSQTSYTKVTASYSAQAGTAYVVASLYGIGDATTIYYYDDIRLFRSANSVLIADGVITGDKIVANTITGGLLATAGIITSAAQIDDAVITNAKIENGAITNAKIGNLEVDTAKIANGAVTNKYAAYTAGSVTIGATYAKVQELLNVDFDGGVVSILFNFKLDEALSNRIDVRLDGTSIGTYTAGSVIFTQVVSGSAFYSFFPNMITIALTTQPTAGTYDIEIYSQRADTAVTSPSHDASQRFLQAIENKK
jgi:hypothetical protein